MWQKHANRHPFCFCCKHVLVLFVTEDGEEGPVEEGENGEKEEQKKRKKVGCVFSQWSVTDFFEEILRHEATCPDPCNKCCNYFYNEACEEKVVAIAFIIVGGDYFLFLCDLA
jgi:hypothetical protein